MSFLPNKVVAARPPRRRPVSAAEERLSLLRPRLPDDTLAALHPAKAVLGSIRSGFEGGGARLELGGGRVDPATGRFGRVPCERVGDGEAEAPAHEGGEEAGGVSGVVEAAVSAALPG